MVKYSGSSQGFKTAENVSGLAKKTFCLNSSFGDDDIVISVDASEFIARIIPSQDKLFLYNFNYISKAREFAHLYENAFMEEGEFEIVRDYSGKTI